MREEEAGEREEKRKKKELERLREAEGKVPKPGCEERGISSSPARFEPFQQNEWLTRDVKAFIEFQQRHERGKKRN